MLSVNDDYRKKSIMNSNLLGCAKNKKNRMKVVYVSMQMFHEVIRLFHLCVTVFHQSLIVNFLVLFVVAGS